MNSHSISKLMFMVQRSLQSQLREVLAHRNARKIKSDGSYVTTGDLLVQEIVSTLVHENLPGAVLISEENALGHDATGHPLVVVLDPIDGTENFSSGLAEWGVSMACYAEGKHVGSLLGCPELNLWLHPGITMERFTSRICGLSSSLNRDDLLLVTPGYEYRILGCCVYNMLNVIRGSFWSFENPKGANAWDILAGLNLALENGLKTTVEGKSYAGEYLPPTRKYRFKIENV